MAWVVTASITLNFDINSNIAANTFLTLMFYKTFV